MDDNDIKKANRKAMPKFMLILVISVLVGGTIGFCAAKYELNTLANDMKSAGTFFGTYIAPWLMLAAAVIVPMICIPFIKAQKGCFPPGTVKTRKHRIQLIVSFLLSSGLQEQPLFSRISSLPLRIPADLKRLKTGAAWFRLLQALLASSAL